MKPALRSSLFLVLAGVAFAAGVLVGRGPRVAVAPAPEARAPLVAMPCASALPALPEGLTGEEKRDIDVFRRASQSVVFITSIAVQRDLFTFDEAAIPQGSGSGFVWDTKGHVVTNFHVVQQSDRLSVTLADQSEWDAKIVGAAPERDIAVLHIDAPADRLAPLAVGHSRSLVVGQRVLAVGNPFGLDHSLTVGVVSALGREINSPTGRRIKDVIQTDAAINPGNSGGPLLDSSGRLIGVNTAIYSPSGASSGIGFAIPVDTVARLVPQLVETGRAVLPGIGVHLNPSLDRYAKRAGADGVVVVDVTPGSPAEKAGLEGVRVGPRRTVVLGDVIVAVDGKPVRTQDDLADAFEAVGVGHEATLSVVRDRVRRDVRVTLVAL